MEIENLKSTNNSDVEDYEILDENDADGKSLTIAT